MLSSSLAVAENCEENTGAKKKKKTEKSISLSLSLSPCPLSFLVPILDFLSLSVPCSETATVSHILRTNQQN
jgi:hypothetical protein